MRTKTNILMVDDQPAKLLSYETILGSLGENLIRATSGQEALNLLLKHEVAVVAADKNARLDSLFIGAQLPARLRFPDRD